MNNTIPVSSSTNTADTNTDPLFVIHSIILGLMYIIILFGTYGNIRLIQIFAQKDQRKMSDFNGLTINLAFYDTFLNFCLCFIGPCYTFEINSDVYKKLFAPLGFMAGAGGALTTIALSLERCFLIHNVKFFDKIPLKWQITSISVASFFIGLRQFLSEVIVFKNGQVLSMDPTYRLVSDIVINQTLYTVLPTIILVVSNAKVYLREVTKIHKEGPSLSCFWVSRPQFST